MIDNFNDTYAMKKLFLLVIVLFLSFQQLTLAAIKEMTSTPDSVYLFSFATSGDDGRSTPSFSERLGVQCRVETLDVLAINYHEP